MIRLAKSVLGACAGTIGCELVPRWRVDRLSLARHLAAIFEKYQVDVVFDVGANQGQYYEFLREDVRYRGLVVSFEPIPELAARLTARAARTARWQVQNCALGRVEESRAFNIMEGSELSSFKAPDSSHVPELSQWNRVARVEQVAVRRLDDVWPALKASHGVSRPFLKLDTQGFDAEVVGGAGTVLPQFVGLQSEVHVLPLYQQSARYLDEIAHFEALGLSVTGLFVVSSDSSLRAIEFDCVMLGAAALQPQPAPDR